jgi:adenine-specific DNA methylase
MNNMTGMFGELNKEREKEEIISSISKIPSNYVGSKRRLLRNIWDILHDNEIKFNSVFDAFSGSSMVSLLFKKMGKRVFCNDLMTSSAITAVCLLENESIPITNEDLRFLCFNNPKEKGTFVKDNYVGKFFTEKECDFLDRYKTNISLLTGDKFYCGLDILNKATLASIPNSNFSVYGKDLAKIRSTHDQNKSFWDEKWRDTTRKRRDENNEIKFPESINEVKEKYKSAFSLFTIENHVSQNCFLGGRYYNGQILAKLEHRIKHAKSKGKEICDLTVSAERFSDVITKGTQDCFVFNSDIIDLLSAKSIEADLLYLDPPYGSASSDDTSLYRFLEEYLYEDKLENLEHIQKGSKRFSQKKSYQEQFENLLSLSKDFKTWLISYNESSYANIDTIIATIKNAGKTNVVVSEVPITYQYRKGKNEVDIDHYKDNYFEAGHKYTQRGIEYLILAQ